MTPKVKTFCERTFSSVLLLGLLTGAIIWNSVYGYAILICLFCNLTSWEWFTMLKERSEKANRLYGLVCGLIYPWLMAAGVLSTYCSDGKKICWVQFSFSGFALAGIILFSLGAFFLEIFRMDYKGRTGAQALSSMGVTLLAFIYPVWLFSFSLLALQANLSYIGEIAGMNGAIFLLLFLIIITKMCDIWAYVSGVLMGGKFIKRPFSPGVSPKKSWEGIIGSFIITSAVASLIAGYMVNWDVVPCLLACMPFIFVLSVAGDLAGSLIKRGLAVKDSGSLLPGIGGIFDLIDSPAFTASAFAVIFFLCW